MQIKIWVVRWKGATDDGIVRTVMGYRRGAIVNWLVVVPKVLVLDTWSDGLIEELWIRYRGKYEAEVVEGILEIADG